MLIQQNKHAHIQFIEGIGIYGNFSTSVDMFSCRHTICSICNGYRAALYAALAFQKPVINVLSKTYKWIIFQYK